TARRREGRSTVRTSAPSRSTAPELTSYSREISDTRLVFPEPVAPTTAIVRPAGTSRSTSHSTARLIRVRGGPGGAPPPPGAVRGPAPGRCAHPTPSLAGRGPA